MLRADYGYLNTYGIHLASERDFDKNITTDVEAIILNEETIKFLEFKIITGVNLSNLLNQQSGKNSIFHK